MYINAVAVLCCTYNMIFVSPPPPRGKIVDAWLNLVGTYKLFGVTFNYNNEQMHIE
jgi:hypothetical protein